MKKSKHRNTNLIGEVTQEKLDILFEIAIDFRASDLHIDIYEGGSEVYLRISGNTAYHTFVQNTESQSLVGRIKVLANMRLDITDRSQDGSFVFKYLAYTTHVRAATAPTVFGENAVCRLFVTSTTRTVFDLEKLGIDITDLTLLKKVLLYESGLVLVSGPTGSGKTTTLYSCLSEIGRENRVIVTLEDPVEVIMPGIRQIKVQTEYGFGFNAALRGVLRQDPDVIMIGEIRDSDTASLAVQAALTGHLVLATIHAPSALEILDRLHALGVGSSSCASVIALLVSQRKVRTLSGSKVVFEMIEFTKQLKSTLLMSKESYSIAETIHTNGVLLLKDRIQSLYDDGYISREEMNKYMR